jgi:hypothetical protein
MLFVIGGETMTLGFLNTWKSVLMHKTKPMDLAGTELMRGLKHIVVAGLILGVLTGIFGMLAADQLVQQLGDLGGLGAALGPAALVTAIIMTPIQMVLGALIGGGILWIIAKIFGGQGGYGNFVGTLSIIHASIVGTASAVLMIINILGALAGQALVVGGITGPLGGLVGLYLLYLTIKATEAVHGVSMMKAIVIVLIVPIIIVVIVGVVIGASALALLGSFGASGIPLQ